MTNSTHPSSEDATDDTEPTLTVSDDLESGDSGDLAHLLAEEIRRDKLSPTDRKRLRDAIAADDTSPAAQVANLQGTLSDLEAYVDRLAPIFPDGTEPNEHLKDLTDRASTMESTLDDVEADLDAAERDRTTIETSIDDVRAEVDSLDDRRVTLVTELEALETTIGDLEASIDRLNDLDERAGRLETDLDEITQRCERLQAFTDELSTALDRLGE